MLNMKLMKRNTEAELLLEGRLDNKTAADAEKILVDVAERFDSVILNMKELAYVSSAGLRSLKMAVITMRKKDGKLVASNVSDPVREVFKITGFLAMIKVI